MNPATALLIIDLIDLALVAALAGGQAKSSFDIHRAIVQQMILEGRDPTEDEIAALNKEIQNLRDRLHSND